MLLTVATARRGRIASALGSGFETVTAGLPHYWLGVILLVVFAVNLRLFPVGGADGLGALVLPALTLAIPLAGFLGQVTRDEFEQVLDQPFVTSARTRGHGRPGGTAAPRAAARRAAGDHAVRLGARRAVLRAR